MQIYIESVFNETYQEYQSYFTHNDVLYDLNKIFKYIDGKKDKLKIFKISDLDWILQYSKPDEERLKKVNIKYPIILTFDEKENKYVVLDGLHRLAKSKMKNKEYIWGWFISEKELENFKI